MKSLLAMLFLLTFCTIAACQTYVASTCQDQGSSPDFVLYKKNFYSKEACAVATFHSFANDRDACETVAELFNEEAHQRLFWCERRCK